MSRIEKEGALCPEKQIHLLFRAQGSLFFYGANAPHLIEEIRISNLFYQMALREKHLSDGIDGPSGKSIYKMAPRLLTHALKLSNIPPKLSKPSNPP